MNWVLKLGGSLYAYPMLAQLLTHLRDLSLASDSFTIVPGGGPFADQVRAAYQQWRLDDTTAHRMAILGMRLYGRLLAGLSKLPVRYTDDPDDAQCAIWLPSDTPIPACLADIPAELLDWDFTSDSISLCLAKNIGAQYLVLLKAISVEQAHSFDKLVDRCFIGLMRDTSVQVICLSADQCLQLNSLAELMRYRIAS
ncbi:MAG: hypothetical protein GDA45_04030 [Chromatiales bacterium]|nr:hypothetical protein [Chromatiales bacterium]